ncbi:MAG TPA: APC family permease, partial [Pyrinomonadaceae bacterium]|nr:APC family permease [Pyrinomonadaceae bacterium]
TCPRDALVIKEPNHLSLESEVVAQVEAPRRRLLRVLGFGFGLAVIIGNTIGAGILRAPGEIAERLPGVWLFLGVWVVGGLYALLGAIQLAELGTSIPRSGGQYVFARRALGDYAGFVVGWSDWLSTCGTTAAVSIVIGEYLGVLFPALAGRTVMIASAVTLTFALLQWRGVVWGSRVQNLTSLLKAVAFIALVLACFSFGGREGGDVVQEEARSPSGLALLGALVLALQSVIYTYDGWNGVIYFSEEVREPARNIPRSLFGGVLSIIGIYLLVNLALVYVLPVSQIAGDNLALGEAAEKIFGARGDIIIRSITIIAMLSSINAYHLMASRVLFSMSRDGLFSVRAVRVNRGGTPTAALFLSTVVALLFIVGGERFETVIAALAFFFVANYTMSFISVFVLRAREPELERPYRAWGYPWTTALALLCSVAFLAGAVASDTGTSLYALLLLALSYPAFILLRRLSG